MRQSRAKWWWLSKLHIKSKQFNKTRTHKEELCNKKECWSRNHLSRNFGSSLFASIYDSPKNGNDGRKSERLLCILLCYMHFVNFFRHSTSRSEIASKARKRRKIMMLPMFGSFSRIFLGLQLNDDDDDDGTKIFCNCNFCTWRQKNVCFRHQLTEVLLCPPSDVVVGMWPTKTQFHILSKDFSAVCVEILITRYDRLVK